MNRVALLLHREVAHALPRYSAGQRDLIGALSEGRSSLIFIGKRVGS
jgi:hypothetical protein